MSVIEDSRKVLQDFIAPELRGITARLDALEKRLDEKFDAQTKRFEDRFDAQDKRFEAQEKRLNEKLDSSAKRSEELEKRVQRQHEEVMSSMRQLINLNLIEQLSGPPGIQRSRASIARLRIN